MKYYSELLNDLYDSQAELERDEAAYRRKVEEEKKAKKEKEEKAKSKRAEAAKAVEAARKAFIAARDAYSKELNDFCETYGAYHFSVSDGADFGISDLFKLLF